jgi:hypothetical protein
MIWKILYKSYCSNDFINEALGLLVLLSEGLPHFLELLFHFRRVTVVNELDLIVRHHSNVLSELVKLKLYIVYFDSWINVLIKDITEK